MSTLRTSAAGRQFPEGLIAMLDSCVLLVDIKRGIFTFVTPVSLSTSGSDQPWWLC